LVCLWYPPEIKEGSSVRPCVRVYVRVLTWRRCLLPAVSALRPTTITAGWPVPPSEPNECCNSVLVPFQTPPSLSSSTRTKMGRRFHKFPCGSRRRLNCTDPKSITSQWSQSGFFFSYPSVWNLGPYPGFPLKVLTRDMGVSCCVLWALLVPATGGAGRESVID